MLKIYLLASCLLIASCAARSIDEAVKVEKLPAGSTTYDQRQTGKYNVHVNIKDVQFFSLSDALGNVGGDYGEEYPDYGELDGFGEADYDNSALTVNPVFAFLGSRPTTAKPTTTSTTEKVQSDVNPAVSSSSLPISAPPQSSPASAKERTTTTQAPKESPVLVVQPVTVNDTIDYEEIPVEVQYYRVANQQKLPANGRRDPSHRYFKRPAVQIIDGHGRANNVKIIESDHPVVKICGRGEFRDNLGRCRVRARRGAGGGPDGDSSATFSRRSHQEEINADEIGSYRYLAEIGERRST